MEEIWATMELGYSFNPPPPRLQDMLEEDYLTPDIQAFWSPLPLSQLCDPTFRRYESHRALKMRDILDSIFRFLNPSELARICPTNRAFYEAAIPLRWWQINQNGFARLAKMPRPRLRAVSATNHRLKNL
ncbi:hypothetical protein DACRYDRAFT_109706 [Dacryopinax primogenitus]|uniref:F-box domain-containing protein n=1 Tax=Dacryopinax primogenitus (strain DJM 731) TaxID=1858805 RepID=M5G767_DACPD|nr:uncharacterized protein DACRYDRAFT_109706 [Dacryopinax primogenitus]EJT99607.1 hypothetical protein DACRYDRAFT_109706 [Dacryopinax primogenitus]